MTPLSDLAAALNAANAAVRDDPEGVLPRPIRHRLLARLGPVHVDGSRALTGPGLTARSALARACAMHVASVADPGAAAALIQAALDLVDRHQRHQLAYEACDAERARLWAACDGLLADGAPVRAVYACYAAVKAVSTALHDEVLDPDGGDSADDADLDPWGWDTALYASAAASGFPWDDDSDVPRRRAFWYWYLDRLAEARADATTR